MIKYAKLADFFWHRSINAKEYRWQRFWFDKFDFYSGLYQATK